MSSEATTASSPATAAPNGNGNGNAALDTDKNGSSGHGFGTLPVFLAGISTILGAVMFLRFGYAVGHAGLVGVLGIIVVGHLVTIPTALAIAEIATNKKVEGGGEYYIISRSFGTSIGSAIGISLYLSQAVSVAFYMIAFAEAFRPIQPWIESWLPFAFDPRMVSLPAMVLLIILMLTKGADLGVRLLYVVVAILGVSLAMFFLGSPIGGQLVETAPFATTDNPQPFAIVFAIVFPAFTGMTAGVGLSGDLAEPRRSIPLGTMAATVVGMLVYVAIVTKLYVSATPDQLAGNQLIMQDIALWGPIIPIGLAAATISSALGSILVAPRTLQALGADGAIPFKRLNGVLAAGIGEANEPRNGTIFTGLLAIAVVVLGDVNAVAQLISMFFMVTYGSLCAISFLEHFAARPSYRPSFRSKWYISLFGAVMCVFMMFQMNPLFALLAIVIMTGLYLIIRRQHTDRKDDLAEIFTAVLTQLARRVQVSLQGQSWGTAASWRPAAIMISRRTFERRSHLDLMRWIAARYGFGTYLHLVDGLLDEQGVRERRKARIRLAGMRSKQRDNMLFMDVLVSPSMVSALAQSLQVPGISGLENNTVIFEFSKHDEAQVVTEIVDSCRFSRVLRKNLLVLRHGDQHYGDRRNIHIWLTRNDGGNAELMVLLAYIVLGHPDWNEAEITVFAALPRKEVADRRKEFKALVESGRLPISEKNIRFLPVSDMQAYGQLVKRLSGTADLVMVGFDRDNLDKAGCFQDFPTLSDVLYVSATEEVRIE